MQGVEKVRKVYEKFIKNLGSGIRAGDESIVEDVEEIEAAVEDFVAELDDEERNGNINGDT
ncbi:hypothetical protein HK407_12g17140 [Ordospora pajunii]|jgi:hypothetical protein|uniref:uncharacterized protein n=1 Tax=Ordospora pajunii TaxID=3039483 RepID=UPI0029528F67|nr:uncharacterized protein HK407_12g17140 [Ordospora pajunii]KAH9410583.1 hypothetical protein HK407_12g17140 [Ordospora pajunii]